LINPWNMIFTEASERTYIKYNNMCYVTVTVNVSCAFYFKCTI